MNERFNNSSYRIRIHTIITLLFLLVLLSASVKGSAASFNGTTDPRASEARRLEGLMTAPGQEAPQRLEIFHTQAPQLRESELEIFVYLPPDYFSSDKAYPVIYIHDGGMLFSTNGGHDTRFNQVLDQMFEDGDTDGIIAVGIASSRNRWDEYSPWVNENMDIWIGSNPAEPEGGEGDAYLDFI